MEISEIITYVTALGVAVALPGPGITALIARTLNGGAHSGLAFMTGLMIGDLLYLTFAVFGLALIASTFANIFIVIKWLSIAYLCYLAWQFWTASPGKLTADTISARDILSICVSGIAVTLGNPKPIAFYLALLPLVINVEAITFKHWLFALVPLTMMVLMTIGGVFIFAANRMRRYLANSKALKTMHRIAAIAMLGAAGAMLFK